MLMCESYSKLKQNRKMVFIADCDDKSTNSKLSEDESKFKKWGNNVYSLVLPIPDNRKETSNICIEHLYSDEVIKTEVLVENQQISRRLYMGNEFDERKRQGIPGVGTVWMAVSIPGFFAFWKSVGNSLLQKMEKS